MTYTGGIWARWVRELLRSRVRGGVAWREVALNKVSHYWRFMVTKENKIATKRDGWFCILLPCFYKLHRNWRWSLKTIRGHKWPSPSLYVRIRRTERDWGVPFAADVRGCGVPSLKVAFPWTVHRYSATQAVCCQWRWEVMSPTPKAVIKYILLQYTACEVSKNTPPKLLVIGSTSVQATVVLVIDGWRCTCGDRFILHGRILHRNIFLHSMHMHM